MSEKDNLQEAEGIQEEAKTTENIPTPEETTVEPTASESSTEENTEQEAHIEEIDSSNAEDAEDEHNHKRHDLEDKDFHAMSMDNLIDELENLVKHENIQVVRSQVETVKSEFSTKFSALLEEKKEEFLAAGGNTIDFRFDFPLKRKFNELYRNYRDRRQSYFKNLEKSLKENLDNRLEIIDEIKGLLNVEENIQNTYKHFKALQERWKNAGPIPRDRYNNVWNNYHHHVENFYDFLHLNRDLRDLDFKHNLEQKQKIVERAEELVKDSNINRSFRELQALHKIWKEELGPVAKEFRDEIWEKFSVATKAIHEKRQEYFADLDKAYEKNLEVKNEIISKIDAVAEDDVNNHNAWQKKIKQIEDLRQQFFTAGKVPIKVNEATWAKFKESVRTFNRKKNAFYKGLKKEQYDNLQKKLELIQIAEQNKDSDDFEVTTPLMKKIQSDWKKIGHVPRKDSDKIWKQFKDACNSYFDKLHAVQNEANKEEVEALNQKTALLDEIKAIEFGEDANANLAIIKEQIEKWKSIGRVPYNKRFINKKFNRSIDSLYNKLNISKSETELLRYDSKLETLSQDKRALDNENNFIRKKIDEIKSEINQLENNMLFFAHADENSPVLRDARKNIDRHKFQLKLWEDKLKKVRSYYA